jgi:biopolymer transport protein ExbD
MKHTVIVRILIYTVIIVFLMILGRFTRRGPQARDPVLPAETVRSLPVPDAEGLAVRITLKAGVPVYTVDGTEVPRSMLIPEIMGRYEEIKEESGDASVVPVRITASPDVEFEAVSAVIEACTESGVDTVVFTPAEPGFSE